MNWGAVWGVLIFEPYKIICLQEPWYFKHLKNMSGWPAGLPIRFVIIYWTVKKQRYILICFKNFKYLKRQSIIFPSIWSLWNVGGHFEYILQFYTDKAKQIKKKRQNWLRVTLSKMNRHSNRTSLYTNLNSPQFHRHGESQITGTHK